MNVTQRSKEFFHQCKICIGSALHLNYGVISCSPCKMFFKRNAQIGQFPTLNLLETNQTILTIDQWNLFSNLTLCYSGHSGLLLAERFIFQQNILPIKLGFKNGPVSEFISSLFNKAQLLFERNPD